MSEIDSTRTALIKEVRAASLLLPEGFNDLCARVFKVEPATVAHYRTGRRFRLDIAEFIIATAQVQRNRMEIKLNSNKSA